MVIKYLLFSKLRLRNVNQINIGNLNASSIANKIGDLRILVQNKIDILVITGTNLYKTFTSFQFLIDGFHTPHPFDRNRNKGGILIYISKDIANKQLYKHLFSDDIEGIGIDKFKKI